MRFDIRTARGDGHAYAASAKRWRLWASENAKIENGTWDNRAAKNVTVATAFEQYRDYAKVQHRAYRTYHASALAHWEEHLGTQMLLAKITPAQVEEFKLKRTRDVSRATVDKELAVLKAFFNWSIARGLAALNPVRRVKLFHEDNSRLRYLSREEYERLIEAARQVKTSPYLVEKIVLGAHTGLRRGSLFNLRWDQIDFANGRTRGCMCVRADSCRCLAGAVRCASSRVRIAGSVIAATEVDAARKRVVLIFNFFDDLKRIAP